MLGSFSVDLRIDGSLLLIITVNLCGRIGIKEKMSNTIPIPRGIQAGKLESQFLAIIKNPNMIPERPTPLEIQHMDTIASVAIAYSHSKKIAIIPDAELAAAGSIAATQEVQQASTINMPMESCVFFSILLFINNCENTQKNFHNKAARRISGRRKTPVQLLELFPDDYQTPE